MCRIVVFAGVLLILSCAPQVYQHGDVPGIPKIQKGDELSEGISGYSTDSTYGYTSSNPVQVGGGPANERMYLSMLCGPDGQDLQFDRIGSYSGFDVPVDGYEVSYYGLDSSLIIFIDMYTYFEPLAPVGLKIKAEYGPRLQVKE